MSVKIFLPAHLFYAKENCDIYGEIQINDNNSISYFIVDFKSSNNVADAGSFKQLRQLGHILRAGSTTDLHHRDVPLSFAYDAGTPNIYLHKLSIKPSQTTHVNVFLYDAARVLQLHNCAVSTNSTNDGGDCATEQCSDMHRLFQLLRSSAQVGNGRSKKPLLLSQLICLVANFPLELMSQAFVVLMEWRPLMMLLRCSVLYEHYQEWRKFRATSKRNINVALDKVLGISLMLVMLFFIPHPGDYLIKASHFIIKELRVLLRELKGSPIGLKLNVHLNNFFLDCFNYHIDLWKTFLDLIEPFVRQLFVPIALLGAMGLSYQLALLSDIISVIGLHTHCFYIYAAVLYKVEIKGLQVLWKVVLGKRYNMLKNRVESHNYMNRQLYLATIFFTSLLFLFPTILVYYIVFTTLRLCIYLVNLLLQLVRRHVLEFPLQVLFQWLTGSFFELESLQLRHQTHAPSPFADQSQVETLRMCVFKIDVLSSSFGRVFSCESGVLQELTADEPTSVKGIFNRILAGTF